MVPDSLQAGHFLGLQRVSTFSPHFSGKDRHDYTSESDKATVSGNRGKKRRRRSPVKP
jgi:hypothetical protein